MRIIRPHEITPAGFVSNVPENDAPAYDPSTSYLLGDTCIVNHRIYEALKSTQGENPPDSPESWVDAGATNRWRMLDGKVGTHTESDAPFIHGVGTGIQIGIAPGRVTNGLQLYGIFADSLVIEMIDPVDGVVYQRSVDLVDNSGVVDYYTYCFLPIERKVAHALLDLPMYGTATIRISLHRAGSPARCGLAIVGLQHKLGDLRYSPALGIMDFSDRKRDEFGNLEFIERDWSRNGSFDVAMTPAQEDYNLRLLAQLRGKPLVWIGALSRPSTHIFGIFVDFTIVLPGPKTTDLSIEIEGLT